MFVPSIQQSNAITTFRDMIPGSTLVIKATAGSGKTTLMVNLVSMAIPEYHFADVLCCAFGKDIQLVLEKRMPKACNVRTMHSVGLECVKNHLKLVHNVKWFGKNFVNGYKYRNFIDLYVEANSLAEFGLTQEEEGQFARDLNQLIDFIRVNLVDFKNPSAIIDMCNATELSVFSTFPQVWDYAFMACREILTWGSRIEGSPLKDRYGNSCGYGQVIDYTDMIWLPYVLGLTPAKFLYVLVDECQDLNAAQLWLAMNCCAAEGKKLFVGDPNQAIFSFAGSDAASYANIKTLTNATELPLSVCYRCPVDVIRYINTCLPHIDIEPAPNAIEGKVEPILHTQFVDECREGDYVLCRTNAELITTAFAFLRDGKRVKVKGRDIMAQIVKVIKDVAKLDGFSFDNFSEFVEVYRAKVLAPLEKDADKNERLIISTNDKIDSVIAIYEGAIISINPPVTTDKLIAVVESLFVDNGGNDLIIFSSIHRAKGLEADNIYLLMPEKLPHPMAKTPIAKEAETNLKFVALSRAKKALYIVQTPK